MSVPGTDIDPSHLDSETFSATVELVPYIYHAYADCWWFACRVDSCESGATDQPEENLLVW